MKSQRNDNLSGQRRGRRGAACLPWSWCWVVLWCVVEPGRAQIPYRQCEDASGMFMACASTVEKIIQTQRRTVTVDPPDATCGLTGKDYYIRLGDVPAEGIECDATVPAYNHTAYNMVDSDVSDTWWQSKIMSREQFIDNGEWPINVTLSMNKVYRMSEALTITFNSGRPQVLKIQKSADYGATWEDLQYYARDCSTSFPQAKTSFADNPAEVICTEEFSRDTGNPQPGGKLTFPGARQRVPVASLADYYTILESTSLKELLTFTDIRIILIYPATDGNEFARQFNDFYQYYYAISDVDIVASCFCNLHGGSCMLDATGETTCECSHNTAGRDCERCLPLYNNRPWQEGSYLPPNVGTANECEKCECNEHASSCTYNPDKNYGTCDDCTHNTRGDHCELCLDEFYPNASLPITDPNICIPCDCEALGLQDPTVLTCNQNPGGTEPLGQCTCKPRVTGLKCDTCFDQFYGLYDPETPGECKECGCNQQGTRDQNPVCDQTSGQCDCKDTIDSRNCGKCKDGYYQFPLSSFDECLECGCDPGGSTSSICDLSFGLCPCKLHIIGPKCNVVVDGFYMPVVDEFKLEPTSGSCTIDGDLHTSATPFDGTGFASCPPGSSGRVEFEQTTGANTQFALSWPHYVAIRYTLEGTAQRTGGNVEITVSGNTNIDLAEYATDGQTAPPGLCPQTFGVQASLPVVFTPGVSVSWVSAGANVTLDRRCVYSVVLTVPPDGAASPNPLLVDSLVFLPALSDASLVEPSTFRVLSETPTLAASYPSCREQLSSLSSRSTAMSSSQCRAVLWSVSAEVYRQGHPCDCDPVGSVSIDTCASFGGQCTCKPGVGGRRCERCKPGYYGHSETGCTPCNCAPPGSVNGACDVNSGQCKCRPNVATADQVDISGSNGSKQCSACVADHYGYGAEDGCSPCACSPVGGNGTQCSPDGQCTCKATYGGQQCSVCADSFFRFHADGCSACECSVSGSVSATCSADGGLCQCRDNVQGVKCDQCKIGFFNLAEYNPQGCQPCFCFEHGSQCTSSDGFNQTTVFADSTASWSRNGGDIEAPTEFLGDKRSSYGQLLSFTLTTGAGRDISLFYLLTLEGDGKKLTYSHTPILVAGSNDITVRFFPDQWILADTASPTPNELYRVLAGITRLAIREVFDTSSVTVSSVTMVTAVAAPGLTIADGGASFVETCTCNAAEFVGGSSCEKCQGGYSRQDPQLADVRYGSCIGCDCRRRTEGPVQCDEMTGVCLNCRNGTTGDRCENCAANVIGSECNVCISNFWALGADGCEPCNCSEVGSIPLSACDMNTGQCVCRPHVLGRQCDTCEDNYYNLTTTGCIECDGCYSLVMDEAAFLQTLVQNLTATVDLLRATDYTVTLGDFVNRLNVAQASLNRLKDYVIEVGSKENDIQTKIDDSDQLIQELSGRVDTLDTVDKVAIKALLDEGDGAIFDVTLIRDKVVNNIEELHTSVAPLNTLSASLISLVNSLEIVLAYLQTFNSNADGDVQKILDDVSFIENTAMTALVRAQSDLEETQNLLAKHQDTSRSIANLDDIDDDLTETSITTAAEAHRIDVKSNDTYNQAARLQSGLVEIGDLSPDFVALNNQLVDDNNTCLAMQSQAQTGLLEVGSKKQAVDVAVSISEQRRMNTLNIVKDCEELEKRAVTAERLAQEAKKNSGSVFTDAAFMLDVMKNFATKAAGVEAIADTFLTQVPAVQAQSEVAINTSAELMANMATAQQAAANALETARQAKAVAQDQNDGISGVHALATELQTTIGSNLDDYRNKAARPLELNASLAFPAQQRCSVLSDTISTTEASALAADTFADTTRADVQKTQVAASIILANLNNIGSLDTVRIAQLQTEVEEAKGLFNPQELAATIAGLQNAYNSHSLWLEELKRDKARLEQEIANIQALQQQIST